MVQLDAQDLKGNAFHKFNGSAQLEISYDPEELRIHPSVLALYCLDEDSGAWRIVPGQVDAIRNVFVAQTTHFSLYALGENSWESVKVPPLDSAQVAEFTGSASYSLPIEVPNGPGGMKPSVSLDYNSMAVEGIYFNTPIGGSWDNITVGAQASTVGLGWTLSSGGYVGRNMGRDIDSDVDDTYSLVVGGMSLKLVPVSSGTGYIDYKSTDGSFMKVRRFRQQGTKNYDRITYNGTTPVYLHHSAVSEDDRWVAWDKTGTRFTFDKRAYYMEVAPKTNGDCYGTHSCAYRPWSWYLTEIQYPSGQTLAFTYTTESDPKCYLYESGDTSPCKIYSYAEQAVYPDEIQYPDGKTKVKFNFGGRPDYVWYWGDLKTRIRYEKQRLNSIQVIVNSRVAREYQLNYYLNSNNPLLPGSKWTPVDPVITNTRNTEQISALQEVIQYGLDGIAGGYQLPKISFSYANQMFLTDVDNGQGGKVTFAYETIDPEAYSGAGAPFTAGDFARDRDPGGTDPDLGFLLHEGNSLPLNAGDNTPLQNTSNFTMVD